jgi:peptide deformylase
VVATYEIRVFGDPVLKRPTRPVEEIDGTLARIVDAMYETMYDAPGVGLAAPQVGVQRRFFVYDVGDGPQVLLNPEVVDQEGEWTYEEGCLSLPGLAFEITRPDVITVQGLDLDGNERTYTGTELLARAFCHEIDHINGTLFVDRLTPLKRDLLKRKLRKRARNGDWDED